MSPALLDPGGASSSTPNGQVSSLPFTVNSFGSFSVSQSKVTQQRMNPSSSFDFGGDFSSGFSNSTPNNPNFSFNTPSLQRPSGGLPRPRLVKIRKHLNSHNLKSSGNLETREGPGFNPFRPVSGVPRPSPSDGSYMGGNLEGVVIKEMRNLNIGKSCGLDDQSLVSKLPDDIRKLNIEDGSKGDLGNDNDSNVGSSVGRGVETEKLPNELRSKLNIKGSYDVDDGGKKEFVFKGGKGSDSLVGSSLDALPDGIKNMNIKGSDDGNTNERDDFGSRSTESSSDLGGKTEKALSTEMERKLNIGSVMGDSTGQTDLGFSSSQIFAKDVQSEKLGDKNLHDFGKSVHKQSTFQGAMADLYLGSKVHMDQPKNDLRTGGAASSTTLFSISSSTLNFQPGANAFGMTSDKPEKKDEFGFTAKQDAIKTPFVEFKTPNSQANIFFGLNKKLEFSAKREAGTSKQVKKRKGKLKQPTPVQLWHGPDFFSSKTGAQDNAEASESYSPMDVSPYQETLADTQCSRESSVTSDESFSLDNKYTSRDSQTAVSSDAIDEDLVAATQHMNINKDGEKDEEIKVESSGNVFDKGIAAEAPQEDSVSVAETESFISAAEEIDYNSDIAISSGENEATSRSNFERQDSDSQMYFSCPSNSEHISGFDFTFGASSSTHSQPLPPKRHHKKKNLTKISFDSPNSSSNMRIPYASSSVQFSPYPGASLDLAAGQGPKTDLSTLQSKVGGNSAAEKGPEVKHEPNLSSASTAAQESCEKWRLRGNQAYANGDSSKAEEYYTQGIRCIPASETSRSCLRALMLCYSNRAATRMSLGRMRDALGDCMMAIAIDPNFLRVQLRAANCYLALGEVENSTQYFRRCLQSGSDICVDRKIAVEASDGLQKAQAAGNEAFQSGRHSEAVEHYTAALSCNVESRPFAAICFCNRAAAYKALGQVTDAIADCSLAVALDGNYLKAISRRATLYEMIRDYGQAASDIERLLSLLMKQMEMKTNQIGTSDRSMSLANDLRQARLWLSEIEEESKKEVPLDFYLILGVEPSVSAAEIKRAYRKAALRHHPDKAVQSLVRNENGDDRLWKEIREEAHKDADKLFKIIGEAYAILSDPIKRSRYDLEEEARNVQKKRTGGTSRAATDAQSYSFDRSGSRRPWREVRRSYGYSTSKGPEPTRSNRFY
ncbi:hypothetical protein DITRI_Ditri05aG0088300 [Diplodiscus trichospermus]